jgi:CHAT domain
VKRRKFITLLGGAAAVALLGYVVLYYSASPAAEDARKAGEAKTAEEAGKAAAEKAAAEKAAAETAATTIQAQPNYTALDVCKPDSTEALKQRMKIDKKWMVDPEAGPMIGRGQPFAYHDHESLRRALHRYSGEYAILVTFVAPDGGCAWIVTRDGVLAYEKFRHTQANIQSQIRVLMDAIGVREGSIARGLYRTDETSVGAMAPNDAMAKLALDKIASAALPRDFGTKLAKYSNVFIAPDQTFHGFPFAMLPIRDGVPLIDTASFQILPSIGQFGIGAGVSSEIDNDLARLSLARRKQELAKSLIIGIETFAEPNVVPLPGARAEAEKVVKTLGAKAILDADARLKKIRAFVNQNQPRYIHIASHGLADMHDVRQNQSFVMLAGGDRLYADALKFPRNSIVVLSACQTGLGAMRPGGIVGLPRLFQVAGVQTVIMSFWNVDDDATSYMMEEFAKELVRTGRPATAHADAVRATRQKYPKPAKWASFAAYGAGQF